MTPVSKKKVVDIRAPLNKLLKGEGFAFDGTMGRITSKYAVRSINPPTIEKVENGGKVEEKYFPSEKKVKTYFNSPPFKTTISEGNPYLYRHIY